MNWWRDQGRARMQTPRWGIAVRSVGGKTIHAGRYGYGICEFIAPNKFLAAGETGLGGGRRERSQRRFMQPARHVDTTCRNVKEFQILGIKMAVDPAMVSYLLSSVASTAKIIEFGMSLMRPPSEAELQVATAEAAGYASQKFTVASPTVIAMSKGALTKPVVEALIEQIKTSQERVIQIIKSNMDDHDRDKRLRDERRNFCAYLAQLRNWNGGKLPPDMQDEWNNVCHDYVP